MVGRAPGIARWLLACCVLLAACDGRDQEAIRFGLASAPISLDPRFASDATSERINRLLYAQLVDFDERARPVPSLASWEMRSTTVYRFHLGREQRHFHDGSRLTADDVAATYRSVLDPATGSPHRGALTKISEVRVIDPETLDFHLTEADALFPGYLGIGILPADGIRQGLPFHHRPVGSGAFRFHKWPSGGNLELVRTSDRQRFVFEQVRDPTMRVLKLLRGEVDLLQNDLPPELVQYLDDRPEIRLRRTVGSNFAYLGFQLEDAHTGRLEVRRAIQLAIDRDAIIRHVFQGNARAASALLPPEHWAGANDLPLAGYDPQQARQLLKQAGYGPGTPLQLTYKTSSDPFRIRIATIIQQQLSEIGIDVQVQSYDWGTFYGDIKAGRFQMYSLAWVGVKSPDIFRYAFHSKSLPPGGANRGRLNDARTDRYIEQALAAGTVREQVESYTQLQRYLLQKLPYVPLWYEDQFSASAERVAGYELAADGSYDALMHTVINRKHTRNEF